MDRGRDDRELGQLDWIIGSERENPIPEVKVHLDGGEEGEGRREGGERNTVEGKGEKAKSKATLPLRLLQPLS